MALSQWDAECPAGPAFWPPGWWRLLTLGTVLAVVFLRGHRYGGALTGRLGRRSGSPITQALVSADPQQSLTAIPRGPSPRPKPQFPGQGPPHHPPRRALHPAGHRRRPRPVGHLRPGNGLLNTGPRSASACQPISIYGFHGVVLAHVFFNLPLATRFILQGWARNPRRTLPPCRLPRHDTCRAIFRDLEWPMLRAGGPWCLRHDDLSHLPHQSFAVALILGGGPRGDDR